MRTFLIGMCDIFLILYLTAISSVKPESVLTIKDFYTLKSMHETLQEDAKKKEEDYQDKLQLARLEQEKLTENLEKEKNKLKEMEESIALTNTSKDQIVKDLQDRELKLKNNQEALAQLSEEIKKKEEARRILEENYQKELENQKGLIETKEKMNERLKQEAELALKEAELAKALREKAVLLKEEALKQKAMAEEKAAKALTAREKAEAEKLTAIQAMQIAKDNRAKAEQETSRLATTVKNIKQDGQSAYTNNVYPHLQTVNVTYKRKASNNTLVYQREFSLLPVMIDGKIHVLFPSKQIGFLSKSDRAPDELEILYNNNKLTTGLINKEDDMIALSLPGFEGVTLTPYPNDHDLSEFMPTLLSVRNNGNVSLSDKLRNISDQYFIVNRDYLQSNETNGLDYSVSGFRGTGTHGERIVLGDQLVDLNGRLIGIASDADHVLRINSLSGWEVINF